MNPFVRFIFLMVLLAALVNLAIVLGANFVNQRHLREQQVIQHEALVHHYTYLLNAPGQAYLAVEWQKTGAGGKVLETSLLIRQFTVEVDQRVVPLPVTRLLIDGDAVTVEGITLAFGDSFNESFKFLRGKSLHLLTGIGQKQATAKRETSLVVPGQAPDITRSQGGLPSDEERRLWHLLSEPLTAFLERGATAPGEALGVTISRANPDSRTLANASLYKVYFGDYGITITEIRDTATYNDIRDEGAKLP